MICTYGNDYESELPQKPQIVFKQPPNVGNAVLRAPIIKRPLKFQDYREPHAKFSEHKWLCAADQLSR
jgi:hypothetical protein